MLNILREQLLFATSYIQLLKSLTVPALSLFNFFRYWHNRIQGVYHAQQSHTCPAVRGKPRLFITTTEAGGFLAHPAAHILAKFGYPSPCSETSGGAGVK
jgi:hypothetical protein